MFKLAEQDWPIPSGRGALGERNRILSDLPQLQSQKSSKDHQCCRNSSPLRNVFIPKQIKFYSSIVRRKEPGQQRQRNIYTVWIFKIFRKHHSSQVKQFSNNSDLKNAFQGFELFHKSIYKIILIKCFKPPCHSHFRQ